MSRACPESEGQRDLRTKIIESRGRNYRKRGPDITRSVTRLKRQLNKELRKRSWKQRGIAKEADRLGKDAGLGGVRKRREKGKKGRE